MPKKLLEKKLQVFLSHDKEDYSKVSNLCNRLKIDGFDPWLHEERILPGQEWNLESEKALRACDVILMCFSSQSVHKDGVIQREYKQAMKIQEEKSEGTIFVIPVRLNECELPFFIKGLQYVDFPDGYSLLIQSLKTRAKSFRRQKLTPTPIENKSEIIEFKKVQLMLEGEFSDFNNTKKQDLIAILAGVLKIEPNDIRILEVYSGSIIVILEIPKDAAYRLESAAGNGDFRLRAGGIISIQIGNTHHNLNRNHSEKNATIGLDKRYLLFAFILMVVAFAVSLLLYPQWTGAWLLLVVAVVVGVVGFIANFRQAFEKKEGTSVNDNPNKKTESGSQPGRIKIEKSSAGGDILASTGGEINKIGTQINNSTININSPAVFSPGSAPPPPSLMIGRDDDLKELKARLSTTTDSKITLQVLTAIKGWPGVGKTTIASALAHDPDIATLFPDGILWTSLGQEPNILSEMATWGRALRTDEILKAKSVEEAQNLLAGLLRNKRMLLIIDDVWKTEDAFPFKVGGVGCATLITTRRDDIANALAPVADNIYRLKVLKDEDALELLKQLAPSVVKQHPNECLVLVQELEGLPLALQVAGRLLNTEANTGFGVIELIDNLKEGAKLLEATAPADRADLVTETTPTIAALLQKSLDRLDEATKECYAYLGVFAPKPATFDSDAMKFVWQQDDPKPTIKALVDRGLLEFVPELSRYQMHAVLVMLAKTLLTDDEQ